MAGRKGISVSALFKNRKSMKEEHSLAPKLNLTLGPFPLFYLLSDLVDEYQYTSMRPEY